MGEDLKGFKEEAIKQKCCQPSTLLKSKVEKKLVMRLLPSIGWVLWSLEFALLD
jgi:hypothetical protein